MGFGGLLALQSDIAPDLARLSQKPATEPIRTATPSVAEPSDGAWLRFALIIGGLAAIALPLAIIAAGGDSTPSPSPTYSAPETFAPPEPSAASSAASAPTANVEVVESEPAVGYGLQLEANQIAYCLAEDIRMSAAKQRVDPTVNSQILEFNSQVSDYNSRCGNYRYLQADMAAAQAYVEAHRSALVEAGAARMPGSPPYSRPALAADTSSGLGDGEPTSDVHDDDDKERAPSDDGEPQ